MQRTRYTLKVPYESAVVVDHPQERTYLSYSSRGMTVHYVLDLIGVSGDAFTSNYVA